MDIKNHTYRGISFTIPKIVKGGGEKIYHPTLLRIKNLIDMAVALRGAPPPEFDMSSYAFIPDHSQYNDIPNYIRSSIGWGGEVNYPAAVSKIREEKNVCGTACCALGTAAWHGIGKTTRNMTWSEYAEQNYGLYFEGDLWSFMFHGSWYNIDNTPEGAAARALKLVVEGPDVILRQTGMAFERGRMTGRTWDDLLEIVYQEDDKIAVRNFYSDYLTVEIQ